MALYSRMPACNWDLIIGKHDDMPDRIPASQLMTGMHHKVWHDDMPDCMPIRYWMDTRWMGVASVVKLNI